MPIVSGVHFTAEEYAALTAPAPPAPEPSREAQLEAALDDLARAVVDRLLDPTVLDEVSSPEARRRILTIAISDLTWRLDRLSLKAAA